MDKFVLIQSRLPFLLPTYVTSGVTANICQKHCQQSLGSQIRFPELSD